VAGYYVSAIGPPAIYINAPSL